MGTSSFKKVYHLVIVIVVWFALALQQYLLIDGTPENGMTVPQAIGRFLLFYTVLTNLLIAILVTVLYLKRPPAAVKFFSRGSTLTAVAVYISVVAIVYNVILRPLFPLYGMDSVANELLHVIVPLLYLGFWILFTDKEKLNWKSAIGWQIFPAVYVVYALIRGKMEGFYAYPFLNLDKLGNAKVALNCAAMIAVFLAVSMAFVFLQNKLAKRTR